MDLLQTKLHPPPARENRVVRRRLLHKLDAAAAQKLTLVCAPAGYGKTTLLSEWASRRPAPVGWLSTDRSDNDLAQFIHYFLAAIQRIDMAAGSLIPALLQPPKPLPISKVLTLRIRKHRRIRKAGPEEKADARKRGAMTAVSQKPRPGSPE